MVEKQLSVLDYILFSLTLAISAGIGIYYGCFGKKQSNSQEVLVGNRKMGVFPASMSLLASFMSGLTILGNPAETYFYGTMFWWSGVAYTFSTIVTANIFIPLFHSLELTSAYEYLELRFNRYVKLLASCIFIFYMTIYMALVCYGPALAIKKITGLSTWISVVSVSGVCIFYTAIGGMKAVMWTDTFQILVMFIGLISTFVKGIIDMGGIRKIIEINWRNERIEFFNFNFDPTTRHTVWSLTFGSFVQWLSIYACNQTQVQRYLSVPTIKKAKQSIYYNLVGLLCILLLSLSLGLVIYAKYETCDPLTKNIIQQEEQLFAYFILDTFQNSIGIPGLFLACLFSASLSTISSGLNSIAAVVLEDIIKKEIYINKEISDNKEVLISKLICLVFGLICLFFTYLASFLGSLLESALSIFGVVGGPMLGLFCLGLFVPFSNSIGAISGTVFSLVFTIWIFAGSIFFDVENIKKPLKINNCSAEEDLSNYTTTAFKQSFTTLNSTLPTTTTAKILKKEFNFFLAFHSVSYTWYGAIGVSIVLIIGSLVSLVTGPLKASQTDPKYLIPFFDRFFPCLPKFITRKLQCGLSMHKVSPIDQDIENQIVNNYKVNNIENNPAQDSMANNEIEHRASTNFSYSNKNNLNSNKFK